MCSGLETVLLLFRGLTGSYSHLKPRSRQRSHCGRSSLHFFFFSLLSHSKYSAEYIAVFRFGSPVNTPYHATISRMSYKRLQKESWKVECLEAYQHVSAAWES